MNSDFSVAVHALVCLNYRGCSLSSEELAANICTNPARVRKIMAKLGHADLVGTREGLEGGYKLCLPGARITLAQISRALELRFVCTGWKSGDPQNPCRIASGMGPLMDELYDHLDGMCKSWLETITVEQVQQKLLTEHNPAGSPCGGRS